MKNNTITFSDIVDLIENNKQLNLDFTKPVNLILNNSDEFLDIILGVRNHINELKFNHLRDKYGITKRTNKLTKEQGLAIVDNMG